MTNSDIDNNHEDGMNDDLRDLHDAFGNDYQEDSELLEPRIMLDAAMVETGSETVTDAGKSAAGDSAEEDTAAEKLVSALGPVEREKRNEVLFVDSAVEDYEDIVADIDPSIEVYVLDGDSDGVEQMAAVLADYDDLDAVHIISHGRSGTLDLGSTKLTAASMANRHADEMEIIRGALSEEADILIYGCNFGAGSRGSAAIAALMDATGADVAASDDLTGVEELGGDWDLEVQAGSVETTALESQNWNGVLVDTDSDGVDDILDIDNDNDGILDEVETQELA